MTAIGDNAFQDKSSITSVSIPASVTAIGDKAFAGTGITEVDIGATVTSIVIKTTKLTTKNVGKNAFKGICKKATIKVPAKKLKAYKTLLIKKGAPKTAKFKK